MARTKVADIPEVGSEAPEFHLPSAQGGQLRLSMRTVRGPVVVVFYSGINSEEDVEYFEALAGKEDEINMAAGSVVGVGVAEPDAAREFVEASKIKSYVLYDYARVASREWGLLQRDKEHGEYARPAVFIVDTDRKVVHSWIDERPEPEEILAKVSEITGLPKPPEEEEEAPKKPKKARPEGDSASAETTDKPERPKPAPEKREVESKAAGEDSEDDKTGNPDGEGKESQAKGATAETGSSKGGEKPLAEGEDDAEPEERKSGE